jgi:hypothetical protein
MKELILIKQCSAIQLAHLYEHLFCAAIDKLFYENELFPYLDYTLSANTHQSGIIYIRLETLTDRASSLAEIVRELKVSLDNDSLSIAASQLIAENEHGYVSAGIENVKIHLAELEAADWQDLDLITSIDTIGTRRRAQPYYIDTQRPLSAKRLSVDVVIDDEFRRTHRNLMPLFRLICFFVTETYETRLSDTFGLYSVKGTYRNLKKSTGYRSIFNIPHAHTDSTAVKSILQEAIGTIGYIHEAKGFLRFAEDIARISYRHASRIAPNALHGLTDTGIVQGSKGWAKISTKKNVELILNNLVVTVRTGRISASHKIALPAYATDPYPKAA